MKLGHVHLKVKDIKSMCEFYQNIFGMEVVEYELEKFAFLNLSSSDAHHVIALQSLPGGNENERRNLGLFHFAFEVKSLHELVKFLNTLHENNVEYKCADQGVCWSIYFDDPEGNGIEAFLDIRSKSIGRVRWGGETKHITGEDIMSYYHRSNAENYLGDN